MDLAHNERERQILQLILARQQMGWPFLAPPDLPAERAQALRQAFDATMKDPEFLAEAKQRQIDVNPMIGRRDRPACERALSDAAGRGRRHQGRDRGRRAVAETNRCFTGS